MYLGGTRLLYAAVRSLFRLAWPLVFRWHRAGIEHLPARGPALVCCNHIAWADPVSLGIASPRPIYFMAKEELFRFPPLAFLFRRVGAFPVRRGQPDRAALRHTLRLLDAGRMVGIFPEGTRSRTGRLGPAEPGAALLAARSGAPVIPAAITGSYRFRARLTVRFGEPFRLPPPPDGKPTSAWLARQSDVIMERIRELLACAEQEGTGA